MNNGFIKFARDSAEADFLQEYSPNAFLLLCLIARRARRFSGSSDGLNIGEAHIGDYKKAGIETRKKYRVALSTLVQRGHVKIAETCRTRKAKKLGGVDKGWPKRATERATERATDLTTKGTKVLLLKSDIWDINSEIEGHQKGDLEGDRRATEGPRTKKEKNERKEKEKNIQKEKVVVLVKEAVPKIAFREQVLLTQEEFDKLTALHGKESLDEMLDVLNSYKGQHGKKYKSDYHTMLKGGWVAKKVEQEKNDKGNKTGSQQRFGRFIDRSKRLDGTDIQSAFDGRF